MNTAVPFAKDFQADGAAQFIHRPAPKPIWVNRAPSEVAAPRRDGDPPKTGSESSKQDLKLN